MIQLQPIIDRIHALLAEDTEASVTYAALEARLAIEKIVYDRLRQRHDYISHEQLKAWTPGNVVQRLLLDVDDNMTKGFVLSMSRKPHVPGTKPEDEDWVEIGTEVGFDAKKIASMWQALAGSALHVRIPKSKDDDIPPYGDKAKIKAKVVQVVSELERLSKGTLTSSGVPVGGEVSFVCTCGEKNKRRANLLQAEQHVYCINPKCDETWRVVKEGDETGFENVLIDVPCKHCDHVAHIPWRMVTKMKYDEMVRYLCGKCAGTNIVKWHLMQASLPPQV